MIDTSKLKDPSKVRWKTNMQYGLLEAFIKDQMVGWIEPR